MYIDDGIVVAQGFERTSKCSSIVRESLEAAGFVCNAEKCHWVPQQMG